MLRGEHITVRYGSFAAVDDLSFRLGEGEWLMLAGPNGAGKSTLIETIAQGTPYTGMIRWKNKDIHKLKGSELARWIGVLSQKNNVGYAYTVEEVVGLGRYAYKSGLFSGRDDQGKAEGLAEGGRVVTIEHNDELEETIRRNLSRSPLSDRIELRIRDCKLEIGKLMEH